MWASRRSSRAKRASPPPGARPRMIRDPATTDLASPGRIEQIPARWASVRGNTVALSDSRSEWTWRELEHGRKQLAELLLTLGVRAGDRVMVVAENCATLVAVL